MSLYVAKLVDKTRPRWLRRCRSVGNLDFLVWILTRVMVLLVLLRPR